MESFESTVNMALYKATADAGKIAADELSRNNGFLAMMAAGSKGSILNITQIAACVGQQNVEGSRIPTLFKNRTLPHIHRFDVGPQVRIPFPGRVSSLLACFWSRVLL